jgi:hypothetical protein
MTFVEVPVPQNAKATVHEAGTALAFPIGPRGSRVSIRLLDRKNKPHRHRGKMMVCKVIALPLPGEEVPVMVLRATKRRTATTDLFDLVIQ